MIFLEDEAANSQAALALIDTLDPPNDLINVADSSSQSLDGFASLSSLLDLSKSSNDEHSVGEVSPKRKEPSAPTSKGDRKRQGYTTRLQRRKKAEMQALREMVMELEAELSRLERTRLNSNIGPTYLIGDDTEEGDWEQEAVNAGALNFDLHGRMERRKILGKWQNVATTKYRERLQSEKTNRKLKAILAQHRSLNASLLQLLRKRSVFLTEDIVFAQEPHYRSPAPTLGITLLMEELDRGMTSLYVDTDLVFQQFPMALDTSISCSMEKKVDSLIGPYIELCTTTPIACPFPVAGEIMWRSINAKHKYPNKTYEQRPGRDGISFEKNFAMSIFGQLGNSEEEVKFTGLHFVRRFDESARVVITMSALLFLPTTDMCFREVTWTSICASSANPSNESVVRTCYRIYVEYNSDLSAKLEDMVQTRDFVFDTMSHTTRSRMLTTQNWLLDESSKMRSVIRTAKV